MKTIKDAKTFDELLDIKYGKLGTEKRDEFEVKAKSFVVGEMIFSCPHFSKYWGRAWQDANIYDGIKKRYTVPQ